MNKKCGMFYYFFLPLLLLSSQYGHSNVITAVINPVVDMLGVAAMGVVDITHNAYEGYLEKNKKEDLEKTKQQLLNIKTDLQTLKGLSLESFTYQFLRQYSYPQTQNVRVNELISLERQVYHIQDSWCCISINSLKMLAG